MFSRRPEGWNGHLKRMILLTTAYFPPIEYFAAIASQCRFNPGSAEVEPAVVLIEACEHYQKQSWRNRCRFLAAGGPETLNYPLRHEDFSLPVSEVRIDWSTPWLVRHERAIISAYSTSPYFEYYRDELFSILDSRPERMLEFNTAITEFFLRKCGLRAEVKFTTEWVAPTKSVSRENKNVPESSAERTTEGILDLREAIHPKRPNTILKDLGLERPYYQVFSPKFGFIGGLSIMDLLFNEGPDSISYLK